MKVYLRQAGWLTCASTTRHAALLRGAVLHAQVSSCRAGKTSCMLSRLSLLLLLGACVPAHSGMFACGPGARERSHSRPTRCAETSDARYTVALTTAVGQQVPDARSLRLKTADGRPYACFFPDPATLLPEELPQVRTAWEQRLAPAGRLRLVPGAQNASQTPTELLEPLQGQCLQRREDWWTYEVCVGDFVRQMHIDAQSHMAAEYVLGSFNAESTDVSPRSGGCSLNSICARAQKGCHAAQLDEVVEAEGMAAHDVAFVQQARLG